MADLYHDKYKVSSNRLKGWDYGSNAFYYITICTGNRECFFGEVKDGKMHLSETGLIAHNNWVQTANMFDFAKPDRFVVMPNHIHGIIQIEKSVTFEKLNTEKEDFYSVETRLIASLQNKNLPTNKPSSDQNKGGITGNANPMLHDNLARIIRWYKGRTTFDARKINHEFFWQSRYHDSIIRDENSYKNICLYIDNNPQNWNEDELYR
ncbi:MAG: transposase [Cytophagaceae bacterium]